MSGANDINSVLQSLGGGKLGNTKLGQSQGQPQGPWNRAFSYAPSAGTPQTHQFFEGTGPVFGNQPPPGGPPAGGPPGMPPPTTGPMPKPPGRLPGDTPNPSAPQLPGGVYNVPGAAYNGQAPSRPSGGGPMLPTDGPGPRQVPGAPSMPPPTGAPTVPPSPTRPGQFNNPKIGAAPRISADNFGDTPFAGDSPAAPASNPLLAALYSGNSGGFSPQELNSYGAQSSNKWNPGAVSVAGSQAGFNTPAPMFQGGHLANGNATMNNGVFTWTPQGLAAMQANSGVK